MKDRPEWQLVAIYIAINLVVILGAAAVGLGLLYLESR